MAQTWTLTASEFSAKHYRLTLTGLYNVLERLREGIGPEALNANEKRVFDDGLVLILKELHDRLDAAVADAYGWPVDLPDEDILARLVALNNERAKDEARGLVAWLRPEYQIPRFGTAKEKAELDRIGGGESTEAPIVAGPRPAFPSDDFAQTAAVMAALAAASAPLDAAAIAAGFKQAAKLRQRSPRFSLPSPEPDSSARTGRASRCEERLEPGDPNGRGLRPLPPRLEHFRNIFLTFSAAAGRLIFSRLLLTIDGCDAANACMQKLPPAAK